MKKDDSRPNFVQQAAACALVIGGVALAGDSNAATAVGTASATVVESVSISIGVPPPPVPAAVVTTPALSGTIFTVESFTGSLSPSGPLLRVGSTPPTDAVVTGVAGGAGAGAAPSTANSANSATVNVTRNADGSLGVSGGSGLTFAVWQPDADTVIVEYN
jgi:hypothetical protein